MIRRADPDDVETIDALQLGLALPLLQSQHWPAAVAKPKALRYERALLMVSKLDAQGHGSKRLATYCSSRNHSTTRFLLYGNDFALDC